VRCDQTGGRWQLREGRAGDSGGAEDRVMKKNSAAISRRNFLQSLAGLTCAVPSLIPAMRVGFDSATRPTAQPERPGQAAAAQHGEAAIEFESSDSRLVAGFAWARSQALKHVRENEPVGRWYEAALPGRNAFCMRDVSHMSTGAQLLGLATHTRNMLHCFAEHISESKRWCTWWEINGAGEPAPADYDGDHDFWYDLPANFDVLDACYRQWLWSRDDAYVTDRVFLNYYRATVTNYIAAWDHDGDGLPEHVRGHGHMGIATYDEDLQDQVLVGADLIAAQYAAYRDYSSIERARNEPDAAAEFEQKARHLKELYNAQWWDSGRGRYFGALGEDGKFQPDLKEGVGRCALELPLYFGLTDSGPKTGSALDLLEDRLKTDLNRSGVAGGVEGRSYMPDIFYRYGRLGAGYSALTALMDPNLKRREYPEVSYSVVGNVCSGLMGLRPLPRANAIATLPQLTHETSWAAVRHAPVGFNVVSVRHGLPAASTLTNEAGPEIAWQAGFPVNSPVFLVNGRQTSARGITRAGGGEKSWCEVQVRPGESCTVSLPSA
jgi:hypothetical protein